MRDPNASLEASALLEKMRHAAGDERIFTADAQEIAQRMLGDTLPANIVMLGVAFQRGLVPVSEAALLRAIELNGVAVETNKTAFALGRLAVAATRRVEAPSWRRHSCRCCIKTLWTT